MGDLVEPVGDRIVPAQDSGPAGQNQECGLEDVFRVLRVLQDAPAHAPDERAMALDKQFEGRLIAGPGKALEQLAIGLLPLGGTTRDVVDVLEYRLQTSPGHGSLPSRRKSSLLYDGAREARTANFFLKSEKRKGRFREVGNTRPLYEGNQ